MRKIIILKHIKLFNDFNIDILQKIAFKILFKRMSQGEIIFTENQITHGLFIIVQGAVIIQKDKKQLAILKENDFFGEDAIIHQLNKVTAIAKTNGIMLYLNRYDFEKLSHNFPEILCIVIKNAGMYLYFQKNLYKPSSFSQEFQLPKAKNAISFIKEKSSSTFTRKFIVKINFC